MLILLGIAAILIAIGVRLRWKWAPSTLIVLAVLLGLHLLALDLLPRDQRGPVAAAAVFVGGLYLMSLVALALRSLGEKQ